MRFACLGSGSRGNAILVESGNTCIVVDCGFSLKQTLSRLQRLGKSPQDVDAVILSHEHADHASGVGTVARALEVPVWMTEGTFAASRERLGSLSDIQLFSPHVPFEIDDIYVTPFPVPHDAREPCQFVFSDGATRLGMLTDVGSTTAHIELMLSGCEGLILECNHDGRLLAAGSYPATLKARIGGPHGHLDNDTAGELLARLDYSRLQTIVAAHLSENNNTPALARVALAEALGCAPSWISVADQMQGLPWQMLSASWI
jgi:phosphoribosyl 1,2-cyclic phosphodiesterase